MNRIKELRQEKKLTQKELANLLGVNMVTLSRYENNNRNPKIDKLEKMAEIFGVSVAYITCSNTAQNENEITITRNEYNRLKEIEHKYNEIKSLVAD